MHGTDYARYQGLNKELWGLRSAGQSSSTSCAFDYDGSGSNNNGVRFTWLGIRPAMTLDLQSFAKYDATDTLPAEVKGETLEKRITITVKTGFFARLGAFFKGLFGLLPKITLNP